MVTPPPMPPPFIESRTAHDAVGALADLFNCVDPVRWNSVARPNPRGIAALLWTIQSQLDPPPPA